MLSFHTDLFKLFEQHCVKAARLTDVQTECLAFPLSSTGLSARIPKIHSQEFQCKRSLPSRTAESSEAKATALKASAQAKLFSILPLPATRKFSPTPPTPGRSSS